MTRSELASYIDHTVLKPETGAAAIENLCREAHENGFAAVCVAPRWVPFAARLLKNSEVHVATVAGFPHGDTLSRAKAQETRDAIEAGAHEVDMVISIGAARDGDWKYVETDIAAVVASGHGHAIIKVILECAYLNPAQIIAACRAAQNAGADYVKTSTGFAPSGAKIEDIRLMRETVGETMGVKAAGGIRDLETALQMIEAGASRLGCSASVAILAALES
jgi:deoxyribose-phosphate aldolase